MSKQKKSAIEKLPVPVEMIERRIFLIRGHKVMIDADLAELYGVTTKRLNEQVKRNRDRFPPDFMFQLTAKEKSEVVAICDHLSKLKFSPVLPYAFTEHGAVMAANVLNSPTAVKMSIVVVRAFIKPRELMATHEELAKRIEQLEKGQRMIQTDINEIVTAVNQLLTVHEPAIGFVIETEKEEPEI